MKEISIVIPNYNNLKYLPRCLNSVFTQMDARCEVILVDDGSTDLSLNYVRDNYKKELDCGFLKLLSISNSGPGAARNKGISVADGKYVGFLDSDDFLLPEYLVNIYEAIKLSAPDIIQFDIMRTTESGNLHRKSIKCHDVPEGLHKLKDVRSNIFGFGKWFPSTRVFRREILISNPFPNEKVFYEDLMTIPFIFLSDYSIFTLSKPLTAYRDNPNGTTNNHTLEHAQVLLEIFRRVRELPDSQAKRIFLINLSRSMVYFTVELGLDSFPLTELHLSCKSIRRVSGWGIFKHLNLPSIFYLYSPRFYTWLEGRRHASRHRSVHTF